MPVQFPTLARGIIVHRWWLGRTSDPSFRLPDTENEQEQQGDGTNTASIQSAATTITRINHPRHCIRVSVVLNPSHRPMVTDREQQASRCARVTRPLRTFVYMSLGRGGRGGGTLMGQKGA